MICNNLTNKISYVTLKQKESPKKETEKLMQNYCETQCSLEYCHIYRLKEQNQEYKNLNN